MSMCWALIEGTVSEVTDDAFQVDVGEDEVWFPFSQVNSVSFTEGGDSDPSDVAVGSEIEAVEIPHWLARQRSLEIE